MDGRASCTVAQRHRGQVLLGFAHDLATDLPHTREALRDGRLNEYRAMLVARETGCLTHEDRATIDEDVCGDPDPRVLAMEIAPTPYLLEYLPAS